MQRFNQRILVVKSRSPKFCSFAIAPICFTHSFGINQIINRGLGQSKSVGRARFPIATWQCVDGQKAKKQSGSASSKWSNRRPEKEIEVGARGGSTSTCKSWTLSKTSQKKSWHFMKGTLCLGPTPRAFSFQLPPLLCLFFKCIFFLVLPANSIFFCFWVKKIFKNYPSRFELESIFFSLGEIPFD